MKLVQMTQAVILLLANVIAKLDTLALNAIIAPTIIMDGQLAMVNILYL